MKRIKSDKKNYIILSLCLIVVIMIAGYAAFSTQLEITGRTNLDFSWGVKITNITPTVPSGSSATDAGSQYTNITDEGLTANFKANLVSPGDSITYDVTIQNFGSLKAKLTSINKNLASGSSSYITYQVAGAVADETVLAPYNTSGDTTHLFVKVTYKDIAGGQSQPDVTTWGLTITLDFEQTNDSPNAAQEDFPRSYYVFDTEGHQIGDSFTPTSSEDEWPSGSGIALKYVLDGTRHIAEAYACTKFEGLSAPICLRGGTENGENPSNFYSANQATITNIKSTFESTVTGGSCSTDNSIWYCDDGDLGVSAHSDGGAHAYINSSLQYCRVLNDDAAICGSGK